MELFRKAEDWLNTLASEAKFFRDKSSPTLARVEAFLDAFGHPESLPQWRVVVGGTAGKGSVCCLVEDVLVREGKKVVTLMSPHLQVVTERIRINGQLISPALFGEQMRLLQDMSEQLGMKPTYYEAVIIAGMLVARATEADVLLAEVGMGGAFDGVNAMRGKRISALTFVGHDHAAFLGEKAEERAATKAGIFTKDCVKGFTCEQKNYSIICEEAHGKVQLLKGVESKRNKKLARNICKTLLGHSDFTMQKIQLPGRWEKLPHPLPQGPTIILDGAHSQDRFRYILPKLRGLSGHKTGLIALAESNDPSGLGGLIDVLDEVLWTTVPGERAYWDPQKLQEIFGRGKIVESPLEGLSQASSNTTLLVTGSLYLCGFVRNKFYPAEKILLQQTTFLH